MMKNLAKINTLGFRFGRDLGKVLARFKETKNLDFRTFGQIFGKVREKRRKEKKEGKKRRKRGTTHSTIESDSWALPAEGEITHPASFLLTLHAPA